MCRSKHQLSQLINAKKLSRQGMKKRASVVLEESGRLREYIAFSEGELSLYDTTGRAKNQISLTKEEYRILKRMDEVGIRALEVEDVSK